MAKRMIACIYVEHGHAIGGFEDTTILHEDPAALAAEYNNKGADALMIFDLSETEEVGQEFTDLLKKICLISDVPVIGAGHIRRLEDVKKVLYAGCESAFLHFRGSIRMDVLKEASEKFGKERLVIGYEKKELLDEYHVQMQQYASTLVQLYAPDLATIRSELDTEFDSIIMCEALSDEDVSALLQMKTVVAVAGDTVVRAIDRIPELKEKLSADGIDTARFHARYPWSAFKHDADGLMPVVVQDYRTDEVLMVAYMNEEAYYRTLKSGRMTYYSRSRKTLWVKGETSGHFQFVKSLSADCDLDTICAKVRQIGAACHTGNRSCFFNEIASIPWQDKNPQKVMDDVFAIIEDRKKNPRKGSYTNYLFDKGLDKILKKLGEENTEIVIAAKNTNNNEIIYEVADYLYHLMVLMSVKGVTWEEIADELAKR